MKSFRKMMKRFFKNTLYVFKLLLLGVALAVFLKVFCFSTFKISSYSMLPTFTGGDHILVNKWILGPRLYKSLDFSDGKKVETYRVKGLRKVKRNDVLVFNSAYKNDWNTIVFNLNEFYVKRCIAVPGDTFYIEKGIHKLKNSPDTLGYYPYQASNWIRFNKEGSAPADGSFPNDKAFGWTILDFGPLYIPGEGDVLTIDTLNIKLYSALIRYETDKKISIKDGEVYLGDGILSSYQFQMNYYFMAGDHVFDSRDSRYWGLVPEDHIVGKVTTIWQSRDPETKKFRWDRFLKPVK